MTTEEIYNFLKQQSDGLFPSILYISTFNHFLDSNPFIPFIDNEDLEGLLPNEKEIIAKYFENYDKYKKGKNKYLEILNSEGGIEKLKNDETLKAGFLEISDIIKDDSLSNFKQSTSGQRILLSIINSKTLYEILSKIYPQQFTKTKQSFELKMFSFKEKYKEQRLKQLHLNTIIDNEVRILNDEFFKYGGFELIEYSIKRFEDFLLDIPGFDDSLLTITGNFERDFDFFSKKQELSLEYLNSIDISVFIEKSDLTFKNNWKAFVSKHLMKIFYVTELKNHIENIKNFQGDPYIEEATEYTLKRQIIAISLLLRHAGLDFNAIDNIEIVKFIRFLTKTGLNQSDIKKTTIYKTYPKVDLKDDNEDLRYVLEQFRKLKLNIT